jgi:feruloyl esterase
LRAAQFDTFSATALIAVPVARTNDSNNRALHPEEEKDMTSKELRLSSMRWRNGAAVLGLTAIAMTTGCGGDDTPASPISQTGVDPASAAKLACTDVSTAALGIPQLLVDSASQASAHAGATPAQSVPAHCLIRGRLNHRNSMIDGKTYAIGFELRLPDVWNGRFFFQGGGGADGILNPALGTLTGGSPATNALSMGFSVASTDAGHIMETEAIVGASRFAIDPQARTDYGYNAVGAVTPVAKTIVSRVYGRQPDKSYFLGCSNGGRQGVVTAARYATHFDGIVAGNPGIDLPKAAVQHAWDTQKFAAAAPRSAAGRALIGQSFSNADLKLVANGALKACDALDGATDGMIDNPRACKAAFTPDALLCSGVKTADCLSALQVNTLKDVFGGPKNRQGEALYADWPYDAGIADAGWRFWKLGFSQTEVQDALIMTLGGASLPYIFTTPPVQVRGTGFDVVDHLLAYDFDRDAPKIFATDAVYTESAMGFMSAPQPADLSAFKAAGGKMIVYHGNSDPVFSVNHTIAWYDKVQAAQAQAGDFVRLFTIPGMHHCVGGPATDSFDMLTPIVNWVEKGVAPASVPAATRAGGDAPWPNRTRPLCPYPEQARYTGSGSLEDGSNFRCVAPTS